MPRSLHDERRLPARGHVVVPVRPVPTGWLISLAIRLGLDLATVEAE
jgi:hypothetical protein